MKITHEYLDEQLSALQADKARHEQAALQMAGAIAMIVAIKKKLDEPTETE